MTIIQALEQSSSSILYELPPGKPNPYKKCYVGPDNRDRVRQKAQTTSACQYYALNYLRHRIGKYPCGDLAQHRAIEKICSSRRKSISAVEKPMVQLLEDVLGIKKLEESTTLEEKQQLLPLFAECSQWKTNTVGDLVHLMNERKFAKRTEINLKFLKDFEIDVQKMFTSEISIENGYLCVSWNEFEQLSTLKKGTILDWFAFNVMAEKYGLKQSSWRPSHTIEALFEELSKNGPLAAGAIIGKAAYADEPFKLKEQVGGRDIYGWKPGAKRNPVTRVSGHMCLIVGAKKMEGKEYVYFIDPSDPSDPKDRSAQKIYICSYKNFTDHIIDLHGRPYSPALAPGKAQKAPPWSKVGYAYYGSQKRIH